MAEQMGTMWMPTFPEVTGDSRRMNSNHAVATIADALAKGLNINAVKAYEACRKGMEEKLLRPGREPLPDGWTTSTAKTDISPPFARMKRKQIRMYTLSKSVNLSLSH